MDAWRDTLLKEHLAAEDSFMWQVRCEGRWDKAAYRRLFAAMLECCKWHDDKESIERWVAEIFWHLSWWVKQQADVTWPNSTYHQNAAINFDHFAFWLFAKDNRADDQFEQLDLD
jgi:hypothetical protein